MENCKNVGIKSLTDNNVKSYLIAWFVVAYCTLYPNTRVVIASGTKGQANLIVTEKIVKDFMNNYPNVAREIRDVQTGLNKTVVTFTNGSTVECVSSTDNARGYRANILIIDKNTCLGIQKCISVIEENR